MEILLKKIIEFYTCMRIHTHTQNIYKGAGILFIIFFFESKYKLMYIKIIYTHTY